MKAVQYSPYDYAIHEDPYPTYARLRDEAPVYWNDELGFWAISRHEDVFRVFRDFTRFSSADGVTLDPAASGKNAYRTMSFLAMDPPQHDRMRSLVSKGFTPKRVADLEPRIRELARGHIEQALNDGEFDFIADVAGKLPMDVICELVGVPSADRDELRHLSDLLVHREEGVYDIPPAGIDAYFALLAYYQGMLAERRVRRTEDLTSALLDAEIDGDQLSDEEIIGFLFLMVIAGNETTTKLLGNAWYWAWRNPDERAKAFGDPARVPDWVEETLRYDTSTQMLARTVTTDVTWHDRTMHAGDRLVVLLGSANRDERVFAEPDRFDLDRETSQSASFGSGRHFCMGAFLARLETKVALEEMLERVVDYDIDSDRAKRVHSVNVRGFASLPTVATLSSRSGR
ncbi:MAG TPA: cytochrome P450 [Acidimicrobiia bacterium]